jgi:uncharacterized coiled-coil protein SlyX
MGHYDHLLDRDEPRTQIEKLTDAIAKLSKAIDKQQSQIDSLMNQNASLSTFINEVYVHTSKERNTLRNDSEVIYHYRFKNTDGTNHNMGGITVVFNTMSCILNCGVAVCNQNDNFDKAFGSHLARLRMKPYQGGKGQVPKKDELGFKIWLANKVIGDKKVSDYFDRFSDLK